jgi:transglutaminase-like putative cysteine protease
MRLRVSHNIDRQFDPPTAGLIQLLRLTPRNHEGQHVIDWRIDASIDARFNAHEDAFGNIAHTFSAAGPLETLRISVEGEVETHNSDGVVRGTVERFPPSLFLRDTPLTQADQRIGDFARGVRDANRGSTLDQLHHLLQRVHTEVDRENEPSEAEAATAAEVFQRKRGFTRDLTHIFIGAAHSLSIPARYVSGYVCMPGFEQRSGHAWAEAYVPNLGWIGFDPVKGACPTEAYIRVAVGLDALGAIPIRGTRHGNSTEKLKVAIEVEQ